MNAADLLDGQVVRLSRDVPNPKPDRRHKHDSLALEKWKAGARFVVRIDTSLSGRGIAYPVLRFQNNRYETFNQWSNPEAFRAIVEALEPAEETLDSLLTRESYGWEHDQACAEVLRVFLAQGRVTLEDVRLALEYASEQTA